jgi:integrase
MEERALAAGTIDRRLSTVCGFYRFAHIDGRIASNPAQYVRRPQLHPSNARGLNRSELGVLRFTAEQYEREHAALAVLLGLNGLRVSEACATNIEDLGLERGHHTLGIRLVVAGRRGSDARRRWPGASCRSAERGPWARATSLRRSPWSLRLLARSTWLSARGARGRSCGAATDSASTDAPLTAGSDRSASAPASALCTRRCFALRSSWPRSTLVVRYATCRSPPVTPTLARHDLWPAPPELRRHAAYVVVAFVADG